MSRSATGPYMPEALQDGEPYLVVPMNIYDLTALMTQPLVTNHIKRSNALRGEPSRAGDSTHMHPDHLFKL